MRVAYYNDVGAAVLGGPFLIGELERRFGQGLVKKIYASDIIEKQCLQGEFDLLVMPGGRGSRFYQHKLAGKGNEEIARFMQRGGLYFGTCAGAYLVSRRTMFMCGPDIPGFTWGMKAFDKLNDLMLFKGVAYGPYSIFPHQRMIKMDGELYGSYHQMGPSFHLDNADDPNVRVLMHYYDIKGCPPAAVACKVGRGLAVLTGIHPEYPTPPNLAAGDVSYKVGPREALFGRMMDVLERHYLMQRETAKRDSTIVRANSYREFVR